MPGRWTRLAWLPIPLLIFAMVALWVVNLRIVWPAPLLQGLLTYGLPLFAVGFIVLPTAHSFLGEGQPSVLMMSCAILMAQIGWIAAAIEFRQSLDTGFAIYSTAVFLSALCHLAGVALTARRRIRLETPARWLAASHAASIALMGMLIWAAVSGRMPTFFIAGQGGTLLRNTTVGAAVVLFVLTAALLWELNRHSPSPFLHWYALGLMLLAIGLSGSMLIAVGNSPLQWATRCTQTIGTVYMCLAGLASGRDHEAKWISLEGVTEALWRSTLLPVLRQRTTLGWVSRYVMAVAAVAAAIGLHLTLERWFGPGLPTFTLVYPAVLSAALVGGLGPGVLATVMAGFAVNHWLLAPIGSSGTASPMDRLGLVIFFSMGMLISMGAGLIRRYRARAMVYDRQAALEAHRELLEMVMNHVPVAINVIRGSDLRIQLVNPAYQNLAPGKAMVGKTLDELWPETHRKLAELCQQVLATGEPHHAVDELFTICRYPGGPEEQAYFSWSLHRVKLPAGEGWAILSTVWETTQKKLAEEHIRELSQRLSYHADNSPLGVIEWGPDMRLTRWSGEAEHLFGWTAEEVLGKRMEDFRWIYPEDEAQVAEVSQALQTGLNPRRFSANRNYRKDGSIIHCEWYNSAMLDESGAVRSILSMILDVTERKRLEESLRQSETKYRNLFENMNEEVHFWQLVRDRQGRIVTWRLVDANPPTLRTWGKNLEEIRGRTTDEIFGPGATDHYRPVVEKMMLEGVSHSFEDYFPNLDKYFRFTSVPLGDHFITTGADITAIKKSEARLKEEADRKDAFLALLGHELRNPLVPIGNAIYLIRKGMQDPALMEKACAIAENQMAHIVRLVDDLLDVSRIARGKVELKIEGVDLVPILQGVARDYQPVFAENNLTLDVSLPPGPVQIDADRARVVQVVCNLLHNAIKFTDPGGHVRLAVGVPGDEWTRIMVKDSGAGIPPEQLSSIFEPFVQRKETVGRTRGGLGLGLALAKGLVELHGGTLSAHSDGPGKGSEFIIQLPMAKVIERPGLQFPSPQLDNVAHGRRILIVEDLVDAATTLRLLLEMSGHTVEVAHDGGSGLEKANRFKPEIILCDIGLPGTLDGFKVARIIRNTPELAKVHLIAMTGFASEGAKDESWKAGFDTHLTKPVDPEALEQLISHLSIPGASQGA